MTGLPRLGSIIPRLLRDRGIDTVFGIPGVHTVELYRGLPASGVRHVTPRHEQGAGFMADGYARATGRPAACFIITGPGLLNIATAMAQALADSIPMLVVTTSNPRGTLGRGEGRLHELRGQSAVAREISVFHAKVMTAGQVVPALDEAFAVLSSQRPGPVVIELPIDLLSEPFTGRIDAPPASPGPPAASAAAIAGAAAVLDGAETPLVIAGGGAVGGAAVIRALVEALGAPTLLTINAKGILPPTHPLLAGGCLPLAPIRDIVRNADAVLALGTELGETDFEYYGEGPLEFSGSLLRVDIDARQLSRNARPSLAILGDAGLAAEALMPVLKRRARDGAERASAARNASLALVEPRLARHRELIETIWTVLPDAVVAGDSTVPSYAGNLVAEAPAPRRWMSAATGFGTLGLRPAGRDRREGLAARRAGRMHHRRWRAALYHPRTGGGGGRRCSGRRDPLERSSLWRDRPLHGESRDRACGGPAPRHRLLGRRKGLRRSPRPGRQPGGGCRGARGCRPRARLDDHRA